MKRYFTMAEIWGVGGLKPSFKTMSYLTHLFRLLSVSFLFLSERFGRYLLLTGFFSCIS